MHSRNLIHSDSSSDQSSGSNAVCYVFEEFPYSMWSSDLFEWLVCAATWDQKLQMKLKRDNLTLPYSEKKGKFRFFSEASLTTWRLTPLSTPLSASVLTALPRLLDLTAAAHSLWLHSYIQELQLCLVTSLCQAGAVLGARWAKQWFYKRSLRGRQ